MKKNLIWGIVLISLGIILTLNVFNIIDVTIFFKGWWTLFIIIPSIFGLFKRGPKTTNMIFLTIGIFLLLYARGILGMATMLKLILPTILIIIGISLIFKDHIIKKSKIKVIKTTQEYNAIFSKEKINIGREKFESSEVNAIFGGIILDLRDSIIDRNIQIDATSIFGGIDLIVPNNVDIKIVSTPIFGNVSNKRANIGVGRYTILINGVCIFGGIDIK